MTKAQLIMDFKNMIGPAGKGSEVDNPGLVVWLNDAIDVANSAILDVIPDYFTNLVTSSALEGQSEYKLPDDFEKAVLVSVTYDGTNWVKALPLNNIGQALDLYQSGVVNFNQTQPYYYLIKNIIGFQPGFEKTIANAIKLWYAYSPKELVEDSDEPDLPRRIQAILKYWMYANYLDQNDEHASAEKMRQRFDFNLEKMVNQLVDQQVDQPKSVEVDVDDQGLYG
jgi:hypothetical protein